MSRNQRKADWADKKVFTTGEAAEICNVSLQTIIRCFDTGRLQGFRVPGSRFRRIPRSELLRFLKNNAIPTDVLESDTRRILAVTNDADVVDLLTELLRADERFEVRTARSGYDAGLLTERLRPHLIALDASMPELDTVSLVHGIRATPEFKGTRVVMICSTIDEHQIRTLGACEPDAFLRKPLDASELMGILDGMMGGE